MARPGLLQHRKFARLARLLGSDALALGHLEILWLVAYEAGDALLGDGGDVEHLARWRGEPGVLAAALLESGFLDQVEDGLAVHDLWDHAPDYVRARARREAERRDRGQTLSQVRAEAGKRGADARWRKASDGKTTASEWQVNGNLPPLPAPSTQHVEPPLSPSETSPPSGGADPQTDPPSTSGQARFQPPTVEQVSAQVARKGYHFDPEAFVAHYQANGWRIGKVSMRDWRAACVTWERRWLEEHGQRVRRRGEIPPDPRASPPPGSFAVVEGGRTRAVGTVDYDEVARRRMRKLVEEAGDGDDGGGGEHGGGNGSDGSAAGPGVAGLRQPARDAPGAGVARGDDVPPGGGGRAH